MTWKQLSILLTIGAMLLMGSASSAQDVSGDLLGRINNLRTSLGLHQYTLNSALSAAAQNHASWMSTTSRISHTQPDGSTPSSRAASYGYPSTAVSENIYMGTNATAETAWNWWLGSPVHYRGITNSAYTEVGIASASGEYGTAFVLVFGNPNGWGAAPAAPRNNTNSTNNQRNTGADDAPAVAAAPPVFIVGVDNVGNIMHEIQPGHTLGEIAFMYGYGWDDLETIRQLNDMTEPEGRSLEVGSVLLIPPYEGTFTPTPGGPPPTAEPESDAAPENIVTGITPEPPTSITVVQSDAITPTAAEVAADNTNRGDESADTGDMGIIASPEPSAESSPIPPSPIVTEPVPTDIPPVGNASATEAWVAMTVTPTQTAAVVAMANNDQQNVIPPSNAETVLTEPREMIIVEDGTPTWLIVAVVVQGMVIIGAGFEYVRRSRKS